MLIAGARALVAKFLGAEFSEEELESWSGRHRLKHSPNRDQKALNRKNHTAIGSSITADASAEGEWAQWRSKRVFLEHASTPFDLLETLALADGRLRDAQAHLARMSVAARHFGYPWNEQAAVQALEAICQSHLCGNWRVRLLCNSRGHVQAQAHPKELAPIKVRLVLAEQVFEAAGSEFVRFKTTRRAHYDAFAPKALGIFDTLLWNTRLEVTECTRGNVALLLDDRWVTPPLHCGLLAGIGRERCLCEGRLVEAVVRLEDLPRVRGLAFINSLRGWIDADLISNEAPR